MSKVSDQIYIWYNFNLDPDTVLDILMGTNERTLWTKLLMVARGYIADEVQERTIEERRSHPDRNPRIVISTNLTWGQEELQRRMNEAKMITAQNMESKSDSELRQITRSLFQIMLKDRYQDYLDAYKKSTGEDWDGGSS